MSAASVIALALLIPPAAIPPPLYPWLPSGAFCREMCRVADLDCREILAALEVVATVHEEEGQLSVSGGGWQAVRLLERYREARRVSD